MAELEGYKIVVEWAEKLGKNIYDEITKVEAYEMELKLDYPNMSEEEVRDYAIGRYFSSLKKQFNPNYKRSEKQELYEKLYGKPAQYKRYGKMWDTQIFMTWKKIRIEMIRAVLKSDYFKYVEDFSKINEIPLRIVRKKICDIQMTLKKEHSRGSIKRITLRAIALFLNSKNYKAKFRIPKWS